MKIKSIALVLGLGLCGSGVALAQTGLAGALSQAAAVVSSTAPTASDSAAPASGGLTAGLVDMAMGQLNLTQPQAEGGLGALFNVAKGNLNTEQFGSIAAAVPNMDSLLAAVPAMTGGGQSSGGGLGGLLGTAASLAGQSDLLKQFESLGLSADMIAPLAQLVMQYLGQGEGGSDLANLFSQGLGNLLGG